MTRRFYVTSVFADDVKDRGNFATHIEAKRVAIKDVIAGADRSVITMATEQQIETIRKGKDHGI